MKLVHTLNKMLKQTLEHARDYRTIPEFQKNIEFGNKAGNLMMKGLCSHLFACSGNFAHFIYYPETIYTENSFDPNTYNFKQDADLYWNNKIIPIEVKYNKHLHGEFIPLRKYSIDHASDLGCRLLLGNSDEFTVVKCSYIKQFPFGKYDKWKDKLCYFVDPNKLKFLPFLSHLKFGKGNA